MRLPELIKLQKFVAVQGEGGVDEGSFVDDVQGRALITPMREKLETRTGGRAGGQHFKVKVWMRAFVGVSVRDRFVWEHRNNVILRIDVVHMHPPTDIYQEFECYLE